MAKFFNPSRLSRKEQQELLAQLCWAISETKNVEEAAELFKDLLSSQEAEMIAKRLKIAQLLIDGFSYEEIEEIAKTCPTTISRVNEWLKVSGEGYRKAVERIKLNKKTLEEPVYDPFSWQGVKRRHPLYFWPHFLLEEILKGASKREKQRLRTVLDKMDERMREKNKLFKQLDAILKEQYIPDKYKIKLTSLRKPKRKSKKKKYKNKKRQ